MEEKELRTRAEEQGAIPESGKKKSVWNKKRVIRFLVCVFAVLVTTTFLALSYPYLSIMVLSIVFVAIVGVAALAFTALFKGWETAFKLSVTTFYIGAIFLVVYFALHRSGFMSSINSADDVVNYINNSGGVAEVIFVAANFLQVTVIPIPSTITTTAGAILFDGIWKPLYLTVIGLVAGSMFAFFLGRVFGVRFANWLVGEKTIKKYKNMTKGRDKIVLFYMFLFPFFPDDFLCILAGMTDYTYVGFFLLQVFSRTIGVLTTILIAKGVVSIPFYGWWLLLWAVIIVAVVVLFILTIKYSEKIENFIMKIIDKLTFGRANKKKTEQAAETEEGATALAETSVLSNNVTEASEDGPSDQGEKNVH